jgi:hypothetical protein
MVLDILVQTRRDQQAAERFLRRVLDGEESVEPQVVVTDKLASYVPAVKRVLPNVASTAQASEQPSGELASPSSEARAGYAALHVAGAGALLSRDLQCNLQPLPPAATPSVS